MTPLEFAIACFLIAAAAGFLGALTGLGGGVVITPALHLLFHVDLRYAIGATLVVDVSNLNGKGWVATNAASGRIRGIHQSDEFHAVERFTRASDQTIPAPARPRTGRGRSKARTARSNAQIQKRQRKVSSAPK